MRKTLLSLAGLTVVGSAFASASYQGSSPINIGLRAGGVLAQDSELQAKSNGWFGAGLDLGLGNGLWPNSNLYVSLDYFGHGNDSVIIANLNNRFFGAATPSGQRVYLIAGLGGAKFDIDGDDDTVFGGRVGAGIEFTKNFYGEATLFLSDKTESRFRTNALGFHFGFRL